MKGAKARGREGVGIKVGVQIIYHSALSKDSTCPATKQKPETSRSPTEETWCECPGRGLERGLKEERMGGVMFESEMSPTSLCSEQLFQLVHYFESLWSLWKVGPR